jgi:hypothetical protein
VTFAIDIGTPHHGWIDIDVTIDVERFAFSASHVLNDPIRELADLARFVASNERGRVRVLFWLEPQGYELAVTRDDELRIALHRSEMASPDLDDPVVLVLERPLEAIPFVREIVRCLRAVQPSFPVAHEHWMEPFPTVLLDELVAKAL